MNKKIEKLRNTIDKFIVRLLKIRCEQTLIPKSYKTEAQNFIEQLDLLANMEDDDFKELLYSYISKIRLLSEIPFPEVEKYPIPITGLTQKDNSLLYSPSQFNWTTDEKLQKVPTSDRILSFYFYRLKLAKIPKVIEFSKIHNEAKFYCVPGDFHFCLIVEEKISSEEENLADKFKAEFYDSIIDDIRLECWPLSGDISNIIKNLKSNVSLLLGHNTNADIPENLFEGISNYRGFYSNILKYKFGKSNRKPNKWPNVIPNLFYSSQADTFLIVTGDMSNEVILSTGDFIRLLPNPYDEEYNGILLINLNDVLNFEKEQDYGKEFKISTEISGSVRTIENIFHNSEIIELLKNENILKSSGKGLKGISSSTSGTLTIRASKNPIEYMNFLFKIIDIILNLKKDDDLNINLYTYFDYGIFIEFFEDEMIQNLPSKTETERKLEEFSFIIAEQIKGAVKNKIWNNSGLHGELKNALLQTLKYYTQAAYFPGELKYFVASSLVSMKKTFLNNITNITKGKNISAWINHYFSYIHRIEVSLSHRCQRRNIFTSKINRLQSNVVDYNKSFDCALSVCYDALEVMNLNFYNEWNIWPIIICGRRGTPSYFPGGIISIPYFQILRPHSWIFLIHEMAHFFCEFYKEFDPDIRINRKNDDSLILSIDNYDYPYEIIADLFVVAIVFNFDVSKYAQYLINFWHEELGTDFQLLSNHLLIRICSLNNLLEKEPFRFNSKIDEISDLFTEFNKNIASEELLEKLSEEVNRRYGVLINKIYLLKNKAQYKIGRAHV